MFTREQLVARTSADHCAAIDAKGPSVLHSVRGASCSRRSITTRLASSGASQRRACDEVERLLSPELRAEIDPRRDSAAAAYRARRAGQSP